MAASTPSSFTDAHIEHTLQWIRNRHLPIAMQEAETILARHYATLKDAKDTQIEIKLMIKQTDAATAILIMDLLCNLLYQKQIGTSYRIVKYRVARDPSSRVLSHTKRNTEFSLKLAWRGE
jgi:hypothetical protein